MEITDLKYYCDFCSAELNENDTICSKCGVRFNKTYFKKQAKRYQIFINQKYVPLKVRTSLLITVISLTLVVCVFGIYKSTVQMDLIQKTIENHGLNMSEIKHNNYVLHGVERIKSVLFLIIGVIFLLWEHRAHRNLFPLGARNLQYSPSQTIIGYILPMISYFKPFLIMKEIWKASDPNCYSEDNKGDTDWQKAPSHFLVPLWWISFLVVGFATSVFYSVSPGLNFNFLAGAYDYSYWSYGIDIIFITAVVILGALVLKINKRQKIKYQDLISGVN